MQFDSLPPEIQKDAIQCRDEYFKFPEQERNIHQFKIDLNGNVLQQISDIVHDFSLDRRENIDFSELIEKKHLPLSILTSKGLNYLYIWKSSQVLQNYNNWTINQIQENKISVDAFNDVIIDLPSLVTCSYLDILDYLPLIFKTIYIPQNSIDEIEKVIKTKKNPLLTDFYSCLYTMNKNEYPRQKVDSSDIAVMAEKLIGFIKREDIIKVGEQLEPKQEIPDKLKVLFEQSNLIEDEAISFCIKSKISIILESAVYRLVLNEIIPDTVTLSIFDILNELLASGKIKLISYVLLLSKLIKGKYVCIPFNYFVVFQYIRYLGYIVSDEVKEIIDSFSDSKIYNPIWILKQITIFIVMLWNTDIPFDNKSKLTLSFYKAMAKRGDIPFGTLFFYNKVIYKLIKTFQYQSEFRDFWRLYSEEIRLSFHMKRV